jgi:nucleotide exchange factor SIL1
MKWTALLFVVCLSIVFAEFVPTDYWQEVADDEVLPAGLHIRLNLDSGHREAKIADSEGKDSPDQAMVVSFDSEDNEGLDGGESSSGEDDEETRIHVHNVGGEVHVLLQALNDKTISEEDLDDLNDLAHDLKYGSVIIKEGLNSLLDLIQNTHSNNRKRESAARALGAAIRHNPSSQAFLVDNKVEITRICLELLKDLTKSNWLSSNQLTDEVLASRIIYVLGSSVTIAGGSEQFSSYLGSEVLFHVYEKAGLALKIKISDFIVDRSEAEWWTADLTDQWCDALQHTLASNSKATATSTDQLHLFDNLCVLKQLVSGEFTDRYDFLEWIADLHARKSSTSEENEDSELVEMARLHRHEFGNPLAGRKHHGDEL